MCIIVITLFGIDIFEHDHGIFKHDSLMTASQSNFTIDFLIIKYKLSRFRLYSAILGASIANMYWKILIN